MGEIEASSSSSWRFSMELLSHVHTLRVFLFNSSPQAKPHQDCLHLEATLLCAPPSLSCSWKISHQACLYALRLPLPLLLFDYSAPPRISTLSDCIQLSLSLLALPPFHLHDFSSLSLAPDGVLMHNPDGVCMPNSSDNPRAQHEAFCANNGIPGDDGGSYSSDRDTNVARDDTHETGCTATCIPGGCRHGCAIEVDRDAGYVGNNIPKNAYHAAADVGHGNDDVRQNREHDYTHAIKVLASPVDNSILGDVHQNHGHDGTHEIRHIATPVLNNHGCHVQEDDRAGNSIHLVCQHAVHDDKVCSHEQLTWGPYHKDDIEAHGTHQITQDTATASNFPGCHNDGMCKVHADIFVHGDDNGFCVDKNACKSHEHNDTKVWHVTNMASNISGCHHHHHGISEVDPEAIEAGEDIHRASLHAAHEHDNICSHDPPMHAPSVSFQHHKEDIKAGKHPSDFNDCSCSLHDNEASEGFWQCQHGRNAVHLQNNGSSLPSQHHDSTVLDDSAHRGPEDQISQGTTIFHCKKCLVKISKNPVRNLVQLPCLDWRDIVENWFGACCCSFGSKAEILSASFEKSLKLRPGKCLVGSSTVYVDFSDVTIEADSVTMETESIMLNMDRKIRQWSTLHFLALGNGFMVWENQHSKYFSWLPVYCIGCASLIGAYACKCADSGSVREGLHLFRCQITAFNADGTLYDMLRYATFKELLAKELRLRTEENTSYRFLIRSLSSQLPLLQLVVLNYDSLICTGNVTAYRLDLGEHPQSTSETTGLVGDAGLQQSIKVLFFDCTELPANELRSTEHWVQDYDAETIFMLEEFVSILKRELLSNRVFYPAACGLSEVFHGSFIHTLQE